jgi:hypothetical protein
MGDDLLFGGGGLFGAFSAAADGVGASLPDPLMDYAMNATSPYASLDPFTQ